MILSKILYCLYFCIVNLLIFSYYNKLHLPKKLSLILILLSVFVILTQVFSKNLLFMGKTEFFDVLSLSVTVVESNLVFSLLVYIFNNFLYQSASASTLKLLNKYVFPVMNFVRFKLFVIMCLIYQCIEILSPNIH